MNGYLHALDSFRREMEISPERLRDLAGNFRSEMEKGLAREASSLQMLPSFLDRPYGCEKGTYLALDFGGTNVRVYLVDLLGEGKYIIKKRVSFPLKSEQAGYDFTSPSADCGELFRFITRHIKSIAPAGQEYSLGHTFSFPCRSDGINHAVLLNWTKEIETYGAVGKDIAGLLGAALKEEKADHIIPTAVINDTVGVMLAGAYQDQNCDIGSILGTGFNSCYLEKNDPSHQTPMIINIEAGNFDKAPLTRFDVILDAASDKPGTQRLEKMTAGKYLGELARLALAGLNKEGVFFREGAPDLLFCENALSAEDIGAILKDMTGELNHTGGILMQRLGIRESSYPERLVVREICRIIVNRSACLVAATYLGILEHLDVDLRRPHVIAVDGSLYEKMPEYDRAIETVFDKILGDKRGQVTLRLVKDGSSIGAAIAAAAAEKGKTVRPVKHC